jgi:hypothetical protein
MNTVLLKDDLDVYSESGCYTAQFESGVFEASGDGEIWVEFSSTVEYPFVSHCLLLVSSASSSS